MTELFSFGRFTLNPDERQLHSDGVLAPVGATAVEILLALVEQAGETVSKDALISRVWGRATVGDSRLYVHIYELRKTIGDDCIVTKSGRGYRFIAPVHRGPALDRPAPPAPSRSGNLPGLETNKDVEGTSGLIGRADASRDVSQSLSDGRLVTLIGPGGVGKTSLALHVAEACAGRFDDGVWLVELAALSDPALAPGAVAAVLGLKVGQSTTPLETLARQLSRKNLLIVLDNCEHLIDAACRLAEALLRAAPRMKILATSREALACIGERIFEVPPLTLPADAMMPLAEVRETAAIRLFVDRVKSADPLFQMDDDDVSVAARICRRVDGLPLAIEMVSGWVGVLGLRALDARLDGSLKTWLRARSTAPARHSTLRATLEWSHDLLSDGERLVLRRLAVFASAFTMPFAEAVIADHELPSEQVFEHLANLIRKSMVAKACSSGSSIIWRCAPAWPDVSRTRPGSSATPTGSTALRAGRANRLVSGPRPGCPRC
jgi:predicted ATPase/DNA-binding winged helix-turn-helix (wHTH) protein